MAVLILALPYDIRADINPWVASTVYDPKKWDASGPYTATPWLHPPTWTPDQDWGVLSGRIGDSTAITGSWGGVRDRLVQEGVSFVGAFLGQLAANPVGGEQQGTSWRNDVGLGAFFDLQRLIDWKGGFFATSFDWKSGDDGLTTDFIGNQFPVQLASGDNATRLVHLAFGQQLLDNNVELVAGRLITGEDFGSLRLACTSLNQAVCANPIAASQSISFPTYPYGVWGVRIKVKPGAYWYAQTGGYIVHSGFRDPNDHGVDFGLHKNSGLLALGELGYLVGNYRGEPGLPGKYKIGAYYDSEKLQDLRTGEPKCGTWGIYSLAEQMLYAEDDRYEEGLSGFLALSYAPPDLNGIEFMAAGGISYKGLFPGRPSDAVSLVSSYGLYSGDLRAGQRARGEPAQNGEVLLELNYRAQITPWLFLQPDLQGIIRPSGRSDIDDAFVIGFALGFSL